MSAAPRPADAAPDAADAPPVAAPDAADAPPVAAPGWPQLIAGGRIRLGSSPAAVAAACAGLAYLAVPYQAAAVARVAGRSLWRATPERAARVAAEAALHQARLYRLGVVALCPAVARDVMAQASQAEPAAGDRLAGHEAAAWALMAAAYRAATALVVVPEIAGWAADPAVAAEVAWALAADLPVHVYARALPGGPA